jgi:hypothetical protein
MRIIALILLVAALASCKQYTCQCTTAFKTTMGNSRVSTGEETYKGVSKKRAANRCEVYEIGKKDKDTTAACALL